MWVTLSPGLNAFKFPCKVLPHSHMTVPRLSLVWYFSRVQDLLDGSWLFFWSSWMLIRARCPFLTLINICKTKSSRPYTLLIRVQAINALGCSNQRGWGWTPSRGSLTGEWQQASWWHLFWDFNSFHMADSQYCFFNFFSFRDFVVLHYLSNPYTVSLSPVGQSHNQCLRKRTQTQISTHICFSGIKSLFYFYWKHQRFIFCWFLWYEY